MSSVRAGSRRQWRRISPHRRDEHGFSSVLHGELTHVSALPRTDTARAFVIDVAPLSAIGCWKFRARCRSRSYAATPDHSGKLSATSVRRPPGAKVQRRRGRTIFIRVTTGCRRKQVSKSQRKSRAGERMPRHFKPQVELPGRDTALKPMIDSPVIFADIAMGCAPDFFLLHVHQH